MNVGNVLNAGFEIQYLLGNGLVQSVSQTIDIYVLKWGISQNDFSIGTAAGIFKSLVSNNKEKKIKKENIRCGQSFRNVKYIIYDHVCDHYVISGVKYAGNLTE